MSDMTSKTVTVVTIATIYEKLSKIISDAADDVISKKEALDRLKALETTCTENDIPFIVGESLIHRLGSAQPNPYIVKDEQEEESSSSEDYDEELSDSEE